MKKIAFITTSIPYVNADPHLGFAMEAIQADVLARYYRALRYETFFLTGTDEHAIKIAKKASELGVDIQSFVDQHADRFRELKEVLNLSFDQFIRTSSETHKKAAQRFWQLCKKNIYKKTYKGLYCVGCEAFYKPGELENDICPNHQQKLEEVEEENYFFSLSKYQEKLEEIYEKNLITVEPEFRKNEILQFIRSGLQDFSISRPADRTYNWGINVPGDPTQKIYVWFDALINYLSGIGFAEESNEFKKFWLENENKIHVIGKDIIKFHLIYWPAMLLSAGLPLPNKVFVHGFITVEGKKMSKTLGNVINPIEVVQKYGTDALRYYLIREIPSISDGDFSLERFENIYNSELANELGNLILRVSNLAEKDGLSVDSNEKLEFSQLFPSEFYQKVESFRLNEAVEILNQTIKRLNKKLDDFAPWKKAPKEREGFLRELISELKNLAMGLKIFMPETGETILNVFSGQIKKPKPLFPKI